MIKLKNCDIVLKGEDADLMAEATVIIISLYKKIATDKGEACARDIIELMFEVIKEIIDGVKSEKKEQD